jgi:hypothetical protein
MDNSFCFYQIRIEGELGEQWSDWFSGMTVAVGNGHAKGRSVTTLTGYADQATLRGILNKLWDLNLVLVSLNPVDKPA